MGHKMKTASRFIRVSLIISMVLAVTLLTACGVSDSVLDVGDRAPDFILQAADGDTVSLSDYSGEQPVLLYFHMALG